jgi:hypothetical protein
MKLKIEEKKPPRNVLLATMIRPDEHAAIRAHAHRRKVSMSTLTRAALETLGLLVMPESASPPWNDAENAKAAGRLLNADAARRLLIADAPSNGGNDE